MCMKEISLVVCFKGKDDTPLKEGPTRCAKILNDVPELFRVLSSQEHPLFFVPLLYRASGLVADITAWYVAGMECGPPSPYPVLSSQIAFLLQSPYSFRGTFGSRTTVATRGTSSMELPMERERKSLSEERSDKATGRMDDLDSRTA